MVQLWQQGVNMWALEHKKTKEVQFVHNPDVHDLSVWKATKLNEPAKEHHKFEKGKLVIDDELRKKKQPLEKRIKNEILEDLVRVGVITTAQLKEIQNDNT